MMKEKIEFSIYCIFLWIIILLDVRLTRYGIINELGTEGNPLMLFLMNTLGLDPTLYLNMIVSFILIISIMMLFLHSKTMKYLMRITMVSIIIIRSLVIGIWGGVLFY